jgi:tellurite resistance protein
MHAIPTLPATGPAPAAVPNDRLRHFPVSWFSTVMGLAGYTVAVGKAEQAWGSPWHLSGVLLALTGLVALVLALLYGLKILRHRADVVAEWRHPVKLAFVPTMSIALLLLSVATLHVAPALSRVLWTVGAAAHLVLTLAVMSSWIHHEHYQVQHLNPAWFIPVVGNILVPIAGVQHGPVELSWFFWSIGIFFWPVLTAILLQRLIFNGSLPERLMPTLFIFIAPPAVGFIAYVQLTGGVDTFARILFSLAAFFTLLLLTQWRVFSRLKFFLSWWAYSFPLAAMTIAAFVMADRTHSSLVATAAGVLLAGLTVLVAGLVWRTARAVRRHEICVEGH